MKTRLLVGDVEGSSQKSARWQPTMLLMPHESHPKESKNPILRDLLIIEFHGQDRSGPGATFPVRIVRCGRSQSEEYAGLCGIDNWKARILLLAGICTRAEPGRMVWNYMKTTGTAKRPPTMGDSLHDRIDAELLQIQSNSALVRSFFKAEDVSYISD
jgi:hypothetical protein